MQFKNFISGSVLISGGGGGMSCTNYIWPVFYRRALCIICHFGSSPSLVRPAWGCMRSHFFGSEFQPKHLVFRYLVFLPGFLLVFCFLHHPTHSRFQENQAFLFWLIFFLGFLNPSNCLVFLELFSCLKVLSNGTGGGVWVVSIDRPLIRQHFRRF